MNAFPRLPGPLLAGLFVAAALPVAASEADLGQLARIEADVVILGEVHDNPVHHANQAAVVAAIRPRALVFEMFGPEAALRVKPENRGNAHALEMALGWRDLGWPEFAYYHPIFIAAPDAVVFGGAIDRDAVRRAVDEGAAAVFGAAAPLFGLDMPLAEEEQRIREDGQQAAHCGALPDDALPGMVEAQRLRDAGLARAVVAAMAETGGPVAVITGNGHARRDWGVPRLLARALPDASVVTVAQFEAAPEGAQPFDHWLVTAPAERPDPCEAFRK